MSRVLGQTEQHVDPASSRLAVTGFVSTSVEVCVCLCVFGLGWEVGGMGVLEGISILLFSSFISVSDGFV